MKISRTITTQSGESIEVEIELTPEEISEANTIFVKNFMKNTLETDFNFDEVTAEELADIAYDKYCEGDGKTEYECIEEAVDEYLEN